MTNQPGLWPTLPLGDIAAEMCLGKMLDKQKNKGELQPYLRNVNVRWFGFDLTDLKTMRFETEEEERYGLRPGDLVICEGGEPGRCGVWHEKASDIRIQKALHRVRFQHDQYDPTFAAYFINYGTITDRFSRFYTGTTIKHLTGKALRKVEFPVPSLVEQRAIVAKIESLFSELDQGVAQLEAVKKQLERYRQSVLKAAFEGKLTAEWRERRRREAEESGETLPTAEDLLEQIRAERETRYAEQLEAWERAVEAWEDAGGKGSGEKKPRKPKKPKDPPPLTEEELGELPKLPKGWIWVRLENLAEGGRSCAYGVLKPGNNPKNGVKFIRIGDLCNGSVSESGMRRIAPEVSQQYPRTVVSGGEFLISLVGAIGRTAVVPRSLAGANTARAIGVVPITKSVLPRFVELFFRRDAKVAEMTMAAHEVARKTLNLEDVRKATVAVAPRQEQEFLVDILEAKQTVIEQIRRAVDVAIRQSMALRQSILKQAFEGRLLSEAELEAVRADPDYEPAEALLERIREDREDEPVRKKKRTTRKRKTSKAGDSVAEQETQG